MASNRTATPIAIVASVWAAVGLAAGVATWHSGGGVLHAAQLAGPALALVSARLAQRDKPRRAGWALVGSALLTPTFFFYVINLVPLAIGLATAILGAPLKAHRPRPAERLDSASVRPFCAASRFFAEVVASIPPDRYEDRWSDEWRLLDLIGHGNRANTLPIEYFERPMALAGPEYVLPENIAARGREAVREMGDDPVGSVRAASARVIAFVESAPDDAMLGTPFGERRLADYLPSRTAELVLHGLDLGTEIEAPAEALIECGTFLVSRAAASGRGAAVVRALSGRGTLPPGFTVL